MVLRKGTCSGTLVSPRVVLTAAHCVTDGGPYAIYFGSDRMALSAPVYSERFIVHPQRLEPSLANTTGFDVALMFLERPVYDQAKVRRPSFQAPADPKSVTVGAAGWSWCGRNLGHSDTTG